LLQKVAVALGPVAGQIDEHVVTVGHVADPQPGQFVGADHVDHGHGCFHRHPGHQGRFERGGVQVVIPFVVADKLGQRPVLGEQAVDLDHHVVPIHLPEPT